jgi:hypothetical protein
VPDWVGFKRSDADVVIAMIRTVAESADPGEYGDGVEVVVQAPKPGWFAGFFGDHEPDQARIAITKRAGEVRYPFSVQLITDHGAEAAHKVPHLSGWAASNSAGLAFLVQKGRSGDRYDWASLAGGAVAALSALRPDADDAGWQVTVDRAVDRTNATRGALRD